MLFPGGLDQAPAGFGLAGEVGEEGSVAEPEDFVGENDFSSGTGVVLGVELNRQGAVIYDMKSIDDVVEAVFHRGAKEGVARGQAVVIGSASVEKSAAPAGRLPGRVRDVLAEVARKGLGKGLERDLGPAGRRDL